MAQIMYKITQKCAQVGLNTARHRLAFREDILLHPATSSLSQHLVQVNYSTDPAKRPSFARNLWENLKAEYDKNKEMKESLSKFREEAKKLEESDALKEARRKFQNIEGESKQSAGAFKDQISGLSDKLKESVEDISKHEGFKKASEFTENISAKTKEASEKVGKAAENISKSTAYQTASSAATTLKDELEGETLGGKVYRPPQVLRKRKEEADGDATNITADEESTGMELHKDSRFSQSWQNFKDNNPMMNKFTDYRYFKQQYLITSLQ